MIEEYTYEGEGYNPFLIRQGLQVAMSRDAQVLIVETANTHLGDFDFYYLNEEQKKEMYAKIKREV